MIFATCLVILSQILGEKHVAAGGVSLAKDPGLTDKRLNVKSNWQLRIIAETESSRL